MKNSTYLTCSENPACSFGIYCCFIFVLLLVGLLPAHAQITHTKDVDYGNLAGSGGSGFAAAWTGGRIAYTPTSLSFGALSGTGGAMLVGIDSPTMIFS